MADWASLDRTVFLQPGELFTGEMGVRVKTVVGSCLAIVMRAPRLGLASIAHCLLPLAGVSADALPRTEALRYVDTTLELMLRAFAGRGAAAEEMEVKLFGGADDLVWSEGTSVYHVGQRNVNTARAILARRAFTVAAQDVGGRRGRVVECDTGTGDVFVRMLPGRHHPVEATV